MKLRDAQPTDLEAVWKIEQDVYGGEAWSLEAMRQELEGDHRRYVVLEDENGAVQGYAGLLALGQDGDIQTIAVSESVRGSGYGRRLMTELLDEAARRKVHQVFLDVRADNTVARGLYASLGFQEIGVRPRYYQPDDIDAIVMLVKIGEQQ